VALLDQDIPVAYGVVKNISPVGACIITDAPLVPNRRFRFKMSFYRAGMLAALGRVVWSEAWREPGGAPSTTLHGVEFTGLSSDERQRLQKILSSADFAVAAD
jgi:hypothetical protein